MLDMGLPRSYFYRRIANDVREVINRESIRERQQQKMVAKVELQEAISRLKTCPVCSEPLTMLPDYPLERSCECGDFTIKTVWMDGDITFEFTISGPESTGVIPVSPVNTE